eukprot:scaffold75395_cov31-Tisochrysis_lutea.AAC.2
MVAVGLARALGCHCKQEFAVVQPHSSGAYPWRLHRHFPWLPPGSQSVPAAMLPGTASGALADSPAHGISS